MSLEKKGTLLWWSKKGYGVIAVPIDGFNNVERYYLNQTRILHGPAIPRAGMEVKFSVSLKASLPGQLPAAINAVFVDDEAASMISNIGVKS